MAKREKIQRIVFSDRQTMSQMIDSFRQHYSPKPDYRSCPYDCDLHPDKRGSCRSCMDRSCLRLAEIGLNDAHQPLPLTERPLCGAKTREGGKCAQRAIPGKRRCRYHGGLSTGPKTEAGKARVRWGQYRRRFREGRL